MGQLQWIYKHFNDITGSEMYKILRLRSEVFVVEQQCVYLDPDNKDQPSWHLCGWIDHEPVAYARIIPPGICYPEASIGRVVTSPAYRKSGYGKILMQLAIEKTCAQFATDCIRIGAQQYLLKFYTDLGFSPTGKAYIEDGIPHEEMIFRK